jgi:hypothetical protein
MFSAARLTRLIETSTVNVIEPSMVDTPNSPVFHTAITQVGAAVGAMNA